MAFALIFLLLAGCAMPEHPLSHTPAVSSSPAPVTASPMPTATPKPIATTAPDVMPSAAPSPTPSPTPTAAPKAAYAGQLVCTAGDSMNIRRTANQNGDAAGKLPGGATADVIAYEGNWAHISYQGVTGYVSRADTIPRHQPDIDVPSGDWASILVNKKNLLPDGFSVDVMDFSGGQVDKRILKICKAMFADAEEDGVTLKLVDAYRSYSLQKKLFEAKISSYIAKGYKRADAETQAATITARPNTSEHQTGLALDIVTPSYTKRNKGFANTAAFKWLSANAQDYGFTLRYKKGKQDLTGVISEPWHWRFVGVKAARAMKKSGEVLEEYFG